MQYVNVQTPIDQTASLVIIKVLVVPQGLGLTFCEGKKNLGFNSVVLLVVGDVPVDGEAHVMTSSISRIC